MNFKIQIFQHEIHTNVVLKYDKKYVTKRSLCHLLSYCLIIPNLPYYTVLCDPGGGDLLTVFAHSTPQHLCHQFPVLHSLY